MSHISCPALCTYKWDFPGYSTSNSCIQITQIMVSLGSETDIMSLKGFFTSESLEIIINMND